MAMEEEQRLEFLGTDQAKKQKFTPLEVEEDLIGGLPLDIIGNILGRLKLKEAVQTSFLSRRWRYRWRFACGLSVCLDQRMEDFPTFANLVEHVLCSISGTIGSFGIYVRRYLIEDKPNELEVRRINNWLVQAVRSGATSLKVITSCCTPKFQLSRELFCCFQRLEQLQLYDCWIEVPDLSAGLLFPRLLQLTLQGCMFGEGGLQRLMDGCPNLRSFCAHQDLGLGNLDVISPHLEEIRLCGLTTDNISLKCCRLRIIHVDLCPSDGKNNTVKLTPPLGVLHLVHNTCKLIQSLKLMKSTLKEFTIKDELYDFWDTTETQPLECSLYRLSFVFASNLKPEYPHLEFCRFLLANSPNLESFYVDTSTPSIHEDGDVIR